MTPKATTSEQTPIHHHAGECESKSSSSSSPPPPALPPLLECDYLVVGAGTAGMSFVDTLLTENPVATVVLVDRNAKPGGHWNHAYPYVKLHQPSCYYGVNSHKLGKHRNKRTGNEYYDVHDLATGKQVLEYFQQVCDKFVATGRVRCFFSAEFEFQQSKSSNETLQEGDTQYSIVVNNTNTADSVAKETYRIRCRKLVTCHSKVTVPSMRKPLVPVHKSVHFVPPNQIPSRCQSKEYKKFIVFGNGKSGMDAVVELVRGQKIDPSDITWILGRDVWTINRDFLNNFFKTVKMVGLMEETATMNELFLKWEKAGMVNRLDDPGRPDFPQVFKAPLLGNAEIKTIHSVQNRVRRGYVGSISSDTIFFRETSQPTLTFTPETTLLVDCMVDNLYGYNFAADFRVFERGRINLGPGLTFYNASYSSAIIAFLESCIDRESKDKHESSKEQGTTATTTTECLDALKNQHCFFLRGKHAMGKPEDFIGAYYMHLKTSAAIGKLPGGMKFIMESRTNDMSPTHHKGGIWRFLWELHGPRQLHKVEPKLIRFVESKKFKDIDHCFGIESLLENNQAPPPQEGEQKREAKISRGPNGTRCFKSCFRRSETTLSRRS